MARPAVAQLAPRASGKGQFQHFWIIAFKVEISTIWLEQKLFLQHPGVLWVTVLATEGGRLWSTQGYCEEFFLLIQSWFNCLPFFPLDRGLGEWLHGCEASWPPEFPPSYIEWLLNVDGSDLTHSEGTARLSSISCDLTNKVGWRPVSPQTCLLKVSSFEDRADWGTALKLRHWPEVAPLACSLVNHWFHLIFKIYQHI